MRTYFSTFITGTQEVIEELLKKRKANITLLLDGLVVYGSDYPKREVRSFRFFNNTFILLYFFEDLEPSVQSVEKILSLVADRGDFKKRVAENLPARRKEFKIVCSLENQMVSVDRGLLENLESVLYQAGNLRLNIKKPNLEFWALVRREGYGFFGIRITYPYRKEDDREKGELRQEIAYIMSVLSDPSPRDVVIDPFAGHGSIPLERAQSFPFEKIIAVEKDQALAATLKKSAKKTKKNIQVIKGNALDLKEVGDGSVDKVISDPPWGIYEKTDIPLDEFYKKMLWELFRVLKTGGIAVLLIGQPEVFEQALEEFTRKFTIHKKYPVLVSGKKATIFKLTK